MEQNLRTGRPCGQEAWKPLGRGHGHMSVQLGAAMAAVPRVVRTGCYVSAALPSKWLKHRALPPPGTGKARHLWTQTTLHFNHCSLLMGGELTWSCELLLGISGLLLSLLWCHRGTHRFLYSSRYQFLILYIIAYHSCRQYYCLTYV